jgi:hypothetical protein
MAPPPPRGRTRHDDDDDRDDDVDERQPLLEVDPRPIGASGSADPSAAGSSYAGSLLEQVRVREHAALRREVVRWVGFVVAILSWWVPHFLTYRTLTRTASAAAPSRRTRSTDTSS